MRKSLFEKAKKLIADKKVSLDLERPDKIFFTVSASDPKVEPHSVILFYEDRMLKHSCTCYQMAAHDDPSRMCSHKLAVIGYLLGVGK